MHDLFFNPPYMALILGLALFLAVVASIRAGKTLAPHQGWIYRAKNPSDFWWLIAIYFLGAVAFVGGFLAKAYFPSN